jgi:hypothetical protein
MSNIDRRTLLFVFGAAIITPMLRAGTAAARTAVVPNPVRIDFLIRVPSRLSSRRANWPVKTVTER